MPTIVRKDGFSIRLYAPPREHPPPHVHVYKAGGHAIVELGAEGQSPKVVEVSGMLPRDAARAEDLVKENELLLLLTWEKLHAEGSLE